MVEGVEAYTPKDRYSLATFAAAAANIFIVGMIMWIFAPYTIFFLQFYVFLLADIALSVVLLRRSGKSSQIGRGMLIGLLVVPATIIVYVPIYLIVGALGPF